MAPECGPEDAVCAVREPLGQHCSMVGWWWWWLVGWLVGDLVVPGAQGAAREIGLAAGK